MYIIWIWRRIHGEESSVKDGATSIGCYTMGKYASFCQSGRLLNLREQYRTERFQESTCEGRNTKAPQEYGIKMQQY